MVQIKQKKQRHGNKNIKETYCDKTQTAETVEASAQAAASSNVYYTGAKEMNAYFSCN